MREEKIHTILVVDDNQNNRDLIGRRLERAGFQVILAEDGTQALERVRSAAVDLVILDIMMPGLSGIDVLCILRQTYTSAELPIIMATAKDQSEDVVEALDHGADDYLTKPLDFPVVMARIQAQLRTRATATGKPAELTLEPAGVLDSLQPGAVLVGKYRLEEELGSGNFGRVYRATHLGFQQPVAIKVLHTSVDDSSESLARFQQEGVSTFRLQHPNVVAVLDFCTMEGGQAFLVMELLEGRSLEVELKGAPKLSPERCGEIILPMCEALADAHSLGIIHRDIKPANIFLQRSRRGEVVKILDFGIAKLVGDAAMEKQLTLDKGVLGTPAFMAPERISGEDYDGRSDVYSLGVLLYQMLSGRLPFPAEGKEAIAVAMMHLTREPELLRDIEPSVSPALGAVVMETLRKKPDERPTAAELGQKLKQALQAQSEPQPSPQQAVSPPAESPSPSRPSPAQARQAAPATPPARSTPAAPVVATADPRASLRFEFPTLLDAPSGDDQTDAVPAFAPRDLSEPWS